MGGWAVNLYQYSSYQYHYRHPHSNLRLPSFSSFIRPKFPTPFFSSLQELGGRPSVSSVRADGNRRERPQKNPSSGRPAKGEGLEDSYNDAQSLDGTRRSTGSSNKEEILALFKRIQSSISKGDRDAVNSKRRNRKVATTEADKPSAESILEVLRQSRTPTKGKSLGKKEDKLPVPQIDPPKREDVESAENSSAVGLRSTTRPPSNFTRRSPIPPLSIPRDKVEQKSETLPATDNDNDDDEQQSRKFEDMKLAELKEVAKSRGIKGYSKLKKSELVELLTKS